MARLKCNTCGGTYTTTTTGGLEYYHACPPLTIAEIQAGLAAKTLVLDPAVQAVLDQMTAADVANPPAKDQPSRVDVFLSTVSLARPNARDENINLSATKRARQADEKAPAQLVSLGTGVTVLVPDA